MGQKWKEMKRNIEENRGQTEYVKLSKDQIFQSYFILA
jgi:hypothetical protein